MTERVSLLALNRIRISFNRQVCATRIRNLTLVGLWCCYLVQARTNRIKVKNQVTGHNKIIRVSVSVQCSSACIILLMDPTKFDRLDLKL